MNTSFFALILLSFQLFAADGLAQRVTLNYKDADVEDVFVEIQRQTGYNILYFKPVLQGAKRITIQCKDNSLEQVLESIEKDQPFKLTIEGTTIVARAIVKTTTNNTPQTVDPSNKISGRITDPNGTPLGGATIIIKRTGGGTQANANGEFNLPDVREDDILIISFTGFQSKTVSVGKGQQFPIVLEVSVKELNTFIYRGYGKISERENLGNVTVVNGEEIARTNVANPIKALIGRIPNVEISSLGNPYAPTKIEFRGRDLIASNMASNPYILIDGVPMTILEIGGQGTSDGSKGITQNGFNGPAGGQDLLFNLNPEDIESITVLKDAAATAIYGSLGGSGVILITTKKGKPGKLKLDVSVNSGSSKVIGFHDMLSTKDYLAMRREALKNDNQIPDISNAPDLVAWDTTRYTNLQKFLYGRTGINNAVQVSVSGGEKNTTYRISGGFQKISNITSYSGSNIKATLQSNFTYSSIDQKIKLGLVSFYSHSKVDEISLSSSHSLLPPNIPPVFDSIGTLNFKGWEPLSAYFPFGDLLSHYNSKTDFLNSRFSVEYEITSGLTISTSIGYSTFRNAQVYKTPILSQDPARNPTGSAQFGNNNNSKWIIEPMITYKRLIGTGELDVIIGSTVNKNNQNGNAIYGSGYVNDNLLNSISNAPNVSASDVWGQYRYAAVFGRINYNLKSKYLVEISARRDGSSRFGPGNRYGNFGAIGVGWIFSEENWLKPLVPILSFGKIRATYGLVGSDLIADYSHLTRWTANPNIVAPYQGNTSYAPIQHANPNLQWQTNKKLEVGMHLGFLDDKLLIKGAWYNERCGNQLVVVPLSGITGFGSINANRNAVVQNSGVEFEVKGTVIKKKNIELSANFNLGLNRNKLISFPGLEMSSYANSLVVGERLYRLQLLKYIGVDPQTGLYMVEDKDKDGVISQRSALQGGDKYFIDDAIVKYAGGFGTDFRWKDLSINVFFSFLRRPKLQSAIYSNTIPGVISSAGNQTPKILDRWQKPGDIARYAKFTTQPDITHYYFFESDAILSNGSFIRMRNISLSYSFPTSLIKKLKISNAKLIIKGDNLLTISNYLGVDPEVPALGGVPTQKIMTFGFQLSL